jgi:AAA15 family ATPase/GTPase
MAIDSVKIKDFLVFKEPFALDFCPGVNVIIGDNGTGKTTLLKVLYAASEMEHKITLSQKNREKSLFDYFSKNISNSNRLAQTTQKDFHLEIFIDDSHVIFEHKDGKIKSSLRLNTVNVAHMKKITSVFIPTTEMLSHSKGFLALNEKYDIPFDATQVDIVVNTQLPEARELSPVYIKVLEKINNIIQGKVIYEDDTFWVQKENGEKIEFAFESEGFRKFGALEKLVRNGLLDKGSVLFWDEPECNINPGLMPDLVNILLELQRTDVQIFIATHNEILASYFDVLREENNEVMFYSLYRDGEQIKADKCENFGFLEPNKLTAEQVKLYEREVEKGLGK